MIITDSADIYINKEMYQYHIEIVRKFLMTDPSQEEIIRLKNKLLTIHSKYYHSDLFRHFDNSYRSAQRQSLQGKKNIISDFKEILSIYYMDINDYSKFEQIQRVIPRKKVFKNAYEKLLIPYMEDPMIREINRVYVWYCECLSLGMDKEIKYVNSMLQCSDDFVHIKTILRDYLKSNDITDLKTFFRKEGYNENLVSYALKLANEFDVDLYEAVLSSEQEKNLKFVQESFDTYREKMDVIFYGVMTGRNRDNSKFDMVDFWCNLPFKGENDSYSKIITYVSIFYPNRLPRLISFFNKNDVKPEHFDSALDVDDLYSNKCLVFLGDVQITDEVNDTILEFMKLYDIPMLQRAYYDVRRNYVSDPNSFINKLQGIKDKELSKKTGGK